MLRQRPTILLTGFGPFPRVPVNATSILVPKIAEAAEKAFPGVKVVAEILPTEWVAGPERARQLYAALNPHLAVHFGVSHRASGFAIEVRGRNRCALSPDAAGALPAAPWLAAERPEYMPTRLPAALIVERLRRRGIAAQVSRDAGSYLCNALLYRMLELAAHEGRPVRNGFVHLPVALIDARRYARGPLPSSPLSWDDVIDGGLEIIATSLGRPSPAQRASAMARLSPSPFAAADA